MVHDSSCIDEPIIIRRGWKVIAARDGWNLNVILDPTLDGIGIMKGNIISTGNGIIHLHTGDGKELSVINEELPFPCPKVKKGIETRYFYGTWQKLSKREGWIPA